MNRISNVHRKKSTASMVKMEHWLILKKKKISGPSLNSYPVGYYLKSKIAATSVTILALLRSQKSSLVEKKFKREF